MEIKPIYRWTIAMIVFIMLWWIIAVFSNSIFFPTPLAVFTTLYSLIATGVIFPHVIGSLKRTLIGFLCALVLGSVLAFIIASSWLKDYATPIFDVLRPIPPIAWIPLAILWFGIGDASASFIIFIAAFFPIFTNVYFGVSSIPVVYHRVSQNYTLTPFQKFKHIIFPFTLPYLLTGARTSMGFGWMAVIAAEMVAGNAGLGYFIEIHRVLLNPSHVISAMIIIGVIGYALNYCLKVIEMRVSAWREM